VRHIAHIRSTKRPITEAEHKVQHPLSLICIMFFISLCVCAKRPCVISPTTPSPIFFGLPHNTNSGTNSRGWQGIRLAPHPKQSSHCGPVQVCLALSTQRFFVLFEIDCPQLQSRRSNRHSRIALTLESSRRPHSKVHLLRLTRPPSQCLTLLHCRSAEMKA
jgi:hypothetical protein